MGSFKFYYPIKLWIDKGAVTTCRTTHVKMAFRSDIKKNNNKMIFSKTTLRKMAFSRGTMNRITDCIKQNKNVIKAQNSSLGKMVFIKMTIRRMTLSAMADIRNTLGRMTTIKM
jgi:hypothetical protein